MRAGGLCEGENDCSIADRPRCGLVCRGPSRGSNLRCF